MDKNTENLHVLGAKILNDNIEIEREWAEKAGMEIESLAAFGHSANGQIQLLGAGLANVIVALSFTTGEKRVFRGHIYGDIAGAIEGIVSYSGALPKVGDKWNFHTVAKAKTAGGIVITFNPFIGPRGILLGEVLGNSLSSAANYGGGQWEKN